MAKRADLTSEDKTIWIGDDAIIRCTLDEDASISGWTFDFVIKEAQASSSALYSDSDSGITVSINDAGSGSTPGVIDVTITDDITGALTHNEDYWYALRRADAGYETTLVHGVWRSLRR